MGIGVQPKRFLDCHLRRFRGPSAIGVAHAPVDADAVAECVLRRNRAALGDSAVSSSTAARVSISEQKIAAWASCVAADVSLSRHNADKHKK